MWYLIVSNDKNERAVVVEDENKGILESLKKLLERKPGFTYEIIPKIPYSQLRSR